MPIRVILLACGALLWLTSSLWADDSREDEAEASPPPASAVDPEAPECLRIGTSKVCIDALQFTNARYAAFLRANGGECDGVSCLDPEEEGARVVKREKDGARQWTVKPGYENHPVVTVTWQGAKAACERIGRRLCTVAEWRAACEGPNRSRFPYGNEFDPKACNGFESGRLKTVPVGSLEDCVGALDGLYDMSGNVWEWSATCTPRKCVVFGGSYRSYNEYSRCDVTDGFTPSLGERFTGFRCCADL